MDHMSDCTSMLYAVTTNNRTPNCSFTCVINPVPDPTAKQQRTDASAAFVKTLAPGGLPVARRRKPSSKKREPSSCVDGSPKKLRVPVKWTPEADAALLSTVQMVPVNSKTGLPHWAEIEKHSDMAGFNKSSKQCRERYMNHLGPGTKKGDWLKSEDLQIISLQTLHGNKWSYIGSLMPGRAEMSVNNRYATISNKLKRYGCEVTLENVKRICYGDGGGVVEGVVEGEGEGVGVGEGVGEEGEEEEEEEEEEEAFGLE
jgi:hypothetical protein